MADRWFERRGERIVLIARCLPIIRTFISLPAGIARMPFWRFTIYTAIGCVPWVLGLDADRRAGRRASGRSGTSASSSSTTSSSPASSPASATWSCAGGAAPRTHERRACRARGASLRWAHRQAYESRLRPAAARARDRRPVRRRPARLLPARPARAAADRGSQRRAARDGGRRRGLDRERRPQAPRRAPAALPAPALAAARIRSPRGRAWCSPRSPSRSGRARARSPLVAVVCALADAAVQLGYGSHWPSDLLGAWVLGGAVRFRRPAALAIGRSAARSRGE